MTWDDMARGWGAGRHRDKGERKVVVRRQGVPVEGAAVLGQCILENLKGNGTGYNTHFEQTVRNK